jgi:Xaa-Pro aminopeptidase
MNYMLKDENSIYYECGYSCDNAIYLSLGSEAFFITDGRYTIDATNSVQNATVITASDIYQEALEIINKSHINKLIFDPKEWSVYGFEKISANTKAKLKPKPDFSHKKRIIKSAKEIEILQKAVKLGEKAFKNLAQDIRKNGFKESEYALTYQAKAILSGYGKYDLSFEPIVAINANAAKPHATPTKSKLHKDDLLLVDAGLKYKRYCSDRTRTVLANKYMTFDTHQRFKSKKIQKAYDTVLKAHDRAIKKARSGMKAKEIDAIARDVIDKAGFGKYFVHSTGHGVGLDIHEMPYISSKSDTTIQDGMVYTIEPGIYIPDEFGIRIEDMVVMQNSKAVVL